MQEFFCSGVIGLCGKTTAAFSNERVSIYQRWPWCEKALNACCGAPGKHTCLECSCLTPPPTQFAGKITLVQHKGAKTDMHGSSMHKSTETTRETIWNCAGGTVRLSSHFGQVAILFLAVIYGTKVILLKAILSGFLSDSGRKEGNPTCNFLQSVQTLLLVNYRITGHLRIRWANLTRFACPNGWPRTKAVRLTARKSIQNRKESSKFIRNGQCFQHKTHW